MNPPIIKRWKLSRYNDTLTDAGDANRPRTLYLLGRFSVCVPFVPPMVDDVMVDDLNIDLMEDNIGDDLDASSVGAVVLGVVVLGVELGWGMDWKDASRIRITTSSCSTCERIEREDGVIDSHGMEDKYGRGSSLWHK